LQFSFSLAFIPNYPPTYCPVCCTWNPFGPFPTTPPILPCFSPSPPDVLTDLGPRSGVPRVLDFHPLTPPGFSFPPLGKLVLVFLLVDPNLQGSFRRAVGPPPPRLLVEYTGFLMTGRDFLCCSPKKGPFSSPPCFGKSTARSWRSISSQHSSYPLDNGFFPLSRPVFNFHSFS